MTQWDTTATTMATWDDDDDVNGDGVTGNEVDGDGNGAMGDENADKEDGNNDNNGNNCDGQRLEYSQFVRSKHKGFEFCKVNKPMFFYFVMLTNSTIRNW